MLEEKMICGFRGVPPQSVRLWRQVEEDIMKLISRPDYMVGSDAIPVGGMVHPRAYGCFPRFFGRLRRRHGYPLEQIIQRMTQNPARRFGLNKRGEIREGYFADLVLFDADNVIDRASFEDPFQHPGGHTIRFGEWLGSRRPRTLHRRSRRRGRPLIRDLCKTPSPSGRGWG